MQKHYVVTVLLLGVLSLLVVAADSTPRYGEATLRSENAEYRRVRIQSPWRDDIESASDGLPLTATRLSNSLQRATAR